MKYKIAIQPNNYGKKDGGYDDDFSACWKDTLERLGHSVKIVDVWKSNILEQLELCHAFMWRFIHSREHIQLARRLLPTIEHYLDLPVFPNEHTAWHYDDKIAQAMIFKVLGISHPETYIFFDFTEALSFAKNYTNYPIVLKLANGAGSSNVKLISDFNEAEYYIKLVFDKGVNSLAADISIGNRLKKIKHFARQTLKTGYTDLSLDVQKRYILFQKFLPNNAFDSRVTVIGNRAFAYRRSNRVNDFRASGSGIIDWEPSKIDEQFIRLAFDTAIKMKMQSCAIDGLYDGNKPVVGEVSYAYVHHLIHTCPGHWELQGDAKYGTLVWKDGQMWPGEAHIVDFLEVLSERYERKQYGNNVS